MYLCVDDDFWWHCFQWSSAQRRVDRSPSHVRCLQLFRSGGRRLYSVPCVVVVEWRYSDELVELASPGTWHVTVRATGCWRLGWIRMPKQLQICLRKRYMKAYSMQTPYIQTLQRKLTWKTYACTVTVFFMTSTVKSHTHGFTHFGYAFD